MRVFSHRLQASDSQVLPSTSASSRLAKPSSNPDRGASGPRPDGRTCADGFRQADGTHQRRHSGTIAGFELGTFLDASGAIPDVGAEVIEDVVDAATEPWQPVPKTNNAAGPE
jgi:hypothetical protein